jgi:hypothetical protein
MTGHVKFGRRLTVSELITWRHRGLEALSPEAQQLAGVRRKYLREVIGQFIPKPKQPARAASAAGKPVTPGRAVLQASDATEKGLPITPVTLAGVSGSLPAQPVCTHCGAVVRKPKRGPVPRSCSNRCRQGAFRSSAKAGKR